MAQPKGSRFLHDNRLLGLILLLALAVRLPGVFKGSLWYDELQSVTHAALPLPTLLKTVAAFDPHPPLYYIQLHLWMLVGRAEAWIRLNSLFISLLTNASLFFIIRRLFDGKLAALAALFLALSPFSVFYAQEARMYALLGLLAVWSFHFTDRFLTQNRVWVDGPLAGMFTLAALYSHGAGFMLLAGLYTWAACTLYERRPPVREAISSFILLQVLVFVAYFPWLRTVDGFVTGHEMPDFRDIIRVLNTLINGLYRPYPDLPALISVALFLLGAALIVLFRTEYRAPVLSFVFAPVAACLLISFTIRPIWHYRALAVLAPFVAFTLAALTSSLFDLLRRRHLSDAPSRTVRYGAITLICAVFLLDNLLQFIHEPYRGDFRAAADYLAGHSPEVTGVYVPRDRVLWGLAWYASGPGSVNPADLTQPVKTRAGYEFFSPRALEIRPDAPINAVVTYSSFNQTEPFTADGLELLKDFDQVRILHTRRPRP